MGQLKAHISSFLFALTLARDKLFMLFSSSKSFTRAPKAVFPNRGCTRCTAGTNEQQQYSDGRQLYKQSLLMTQSVSCLRTWIQTGSSALWSWEIVNVSALSLRLSPKRGAESRGVRDRGGERGGEREGGGEDLVTGVTLAPCHDYPDSQCPSHRCSTTWCDFETVLPMSDYLGSIWLLDADWLSLCGCL